MPEKRQYKRFDFGGNVDLKIENGRERILRAYLDDIGLGGFRVYSEKEIDRWFSSRILIRIELNN